MLVKYNRGQHINRDMIVKGLPGQIGIANFATLVTLAAFAGKNGHIKISQGELAKVMSLSRETVNRKLNSMLALKFKGKPVLTKTVSGIYKIAPRLLENNTLR